MTPDHGGTSRICGSRGPRQHRQQEQRVAGLARPAIDRDAQAGSNGFIGPSRAPARRRLRRWPLLTPPTSRRRPTGSQQRCRRGRPPAQAGRQSQRSRLRDRAGRVPSRSRPCCAAADQVAWRMPPAGLARRLLPRHLVGPVAASPRRTPSRHPARLRRAWPDWAPGSPDGAAGGAAAARLRRWPGQRFARCAGYARRGNSPTESGSRSAAAAASARRAAPAFSRTVDRSAGPSATSGLTTSSLSVSAQPPGRWRPEAHRRRQFAINGPSCSVISDRSCARRRSQTRPSRAVSSSPATSRAVACSATSRRWPARKVSRWPRLSW